MMYAWIKAKGVSIEALVMCFFSSDPVPSRRYGPNERTAFQLV